MIAVSVPSVPRPRPPPPSLRNFAMYINVPHWGSTDPSPYVSPTWYRPRPAAHPPPRPPCPHPPFPSLPSSTPSPPRLRLRRSEKTPRKSLHSTTTTMGTHSGGTAAPPQSQSTARPRYFLPQTQRPPPTQPPRRLPEFRCCSHAPRKVAPPGTPSPARYPPRPPPPPHPRLRRHPLWRL
jgi:hypothetical protein